MIITWIVNMMSATTF